jgi:hypothetical protein
MTKNEKGTVNGRVLISFPPDIEETIRRRAEENDRTINGEVVHLVRFALRDKRIQDEAPTIIP